jgi:hypothetical protein
LAAWADGGLGKAEAAAVELHLSECDRCTAMAATFVRTAPDAPAAESLWRRWNLRWLVPVATAATVAALWVLIPSSDREPTPTLESDVSLPAEPAPVAPAAEPPSVADARVQKRENTPADADRSATFDRREEAPPPVERRAARGEARPVRPVAQEREEIAAVAPPAAPPPPPARSDQAALSAPAPPAGRAAASTAESSRDGTSRDKTLQQANRQGFAAVAAQFEVVSPDPMTRWRVIGAGRVERTANGGATWEPASLPESATLTGGSSPASSICWLVGRTGAMYVTTDGLRFVRVPPPDRIDFVSIQAIDARRATVVTVDGRTFRTDDQGATWIRVTP